MASGAARTPITSALAQFTKMMVGTHPAETYSPFSIHQCLGLLYSLGNGFTRATLQKFLRLPEDTTLEEVKSVGQMLMSNGQFRCGSQLALKSEFLPKEGTPQEEFLKKTFEPVDLLTFDAEGEFMAKANTWCDELTRGLIPELIKPENLAGGVDLAALNACHFLGKWKAPFPVENTRKAPFTKKDGSRVEVDMMSVNTHFSYHETPTHTLVAVPYEGGEFEMVVGVPAEGRSVEGLRDSDLWIPTAEMDGGGKVILSLPKFTHKDRVSLLEWVKIHAGAEGLDRLDLSRVTDVPLQLSDIIHEVVVKVDEKETEAAAASAAMATRCLPHMITAEKTFRYVLRHIPSGVVVISGEFDGESA